MKAVSWLITRKSPPGSVYGRMHRVVGAGAEGATGEAQAGQSPQSAPEQRTWAAARAAAWRNSLEGRAGSLGLEGPPEGNRAPLPEWAAPALLSTQNKIRFVSYFFKIQHFPATPIITRLAKKVRLDLSVTAYRNPNELLAHPMHSFVSIFPTDNYVPIQHGT